jgi:predicted RNA methylase
MTVRGANYPRRALDDYPTPTYVTVALLKFMHKELSIRLCDPAPGAGQLVKTFKKTGYREVKGPRDFLQQAWNGDECDFLMNPPYGDWP